MSSLLLSALVQISPSACWISILNLCSNPDLLIIVTELSETTSKKCLIRPNFTTILITKQLHSLAGRGKGTMEGKAEVRVGEGGDSVNNNSINFQ